MVASTGVRVLVDYRPALRARTGIGEYVHELARAFAAGPSPRPTVTLFSSSWRDRLSPERMAEFPGVAVVDRAVPVAALGWAWRRWGLPTIEHLAGSHDVAHSPTPLRLPARHAAQVVTVFDLHFLDRPADVGPAERAMAARVHTEVARADHVIAGSRYAADLVTTRLGIDADRVTTTPLGAPHWAPQVREARGDSPGRALLFLGTLETRKNVGLVLDAYEHLLARGHDVPPLVLAGGLGAGGAAWIERAVRAPLAAHVTVTGYVGDAERQALYTSARAVVVPSLDEGFGLPALDAMACGVPVIATPVGALPEVLGEAAMFAPLGAPELWADAILRTFDATHLTDLRARGLARAARFTWAATAAATLGAYQSAVTARRERH